MKRWKPIEGEEYWYVTDLLRVLSHIWKSHPIDNRYYEVKNCFQTCKSAQEAVKKIKHLLSTLEEKGDDHHCYTERER